MPEQPDNIVPITPNARTAAAKFSAEHDRELLTILFTDLVDSTKLQQEAGNVEAARLTELHRKIVRDELAKYDAREIEWAGDSCLAVFTKPSDAVVFALRMQAEHRRVRESEPKLAKVRVGMHLGEVVVKKRSDGGKKTEDLFGLQVSEAARVMSVARGNQVFCTRAVFDNARSALKGRAIEGVGDAVWVNYGAYLLKGSEEPVELCEIGSADVAVLKAPETNDKVAPVLPGGVEAMRALIPYEDSVAPERRLPRWVLAVAGVALVVLGFMANRFGPGMAGLDPVANLDGPVNSIAVLPLRNLSLQGNEDYFAESMTEAITSELAKIKSLHVRGSTSAMQYKDTDLDIREIAKALNVDALVEGSVTREGEDVRINVTLMRGATDTQLWTDSYTETITSVLKLQSDVALAIAEAVNTEITGEERARIATTRQVDPRAHDAYVLGQHLLRSLEREQMERSVELFQTAVEIDPNFAEAWVGLASAYIDTSDWGFVSADEYKPQARTALERAMEIDPGMGEAYGARAELAVSYEQDWDAARRYGEKGVELAPNSAITHARYAEYLQSVGRVRETVQQAREAIQLDASDTNAGQWSAGMLLGAGEVDDTRKWVSALEASNPGHPAGMQAAVEIAKVLGSVDEALNASREFHKRIKREAASSEVHAEVLAWFGRTGEARAVLAAALESGNDSINNGVVASAYLTLGELDSAFEWYEKALAQRRATAIIFKATPYFFGYIDHPAWQAFRADDRYWELCERMGYPPFPPEHPGYADEQRWMAKKAARELAAAQPKPVRRYSINLPTAIPKFDDGFAVIAPDGTHVGYATSAASGPELYLWSVEDATATLAGGASRVWTKFFSPDSKQLGYIEETRFTVNTVDIQTGATQTVARAADNWGATWGRNGTIVYAPEWGSGLWQVPAKGGTPVQLTEPDADQRESHRTPHFLPDGRHVLFNVRAGPRTQDSSVALLSIEERTITPLIDNAMDAKYAPTGHIVFARNGDLWAVPFDLASSTLKGEPILVLNDVQMVTSYGVACYSFSDTGTLVYVKPDATTDSLVWIDREGRESVVIPQRSERSYSMAALSPDNKRVAIVERSPTARELWIIDRARGARTRIPSDGGQDSITWEATGNSIVFSSNLDGAFDIFRADADGTGAVERITDSAMNSHPTSVSRDGVIAYIRYSPDGSREIWTLDPDVDSEPAPYIAGPQSHDDAMIHPTGNWIAYDSNVSGQSEIYIDSFPEPGNRTVVSLAGGAKSRWSPEGDELFYVEGNRLMGVEVTIEDKSVTAGVPTIVFEKDFKHTYSFFDVDTNAERFLATKADSPNTELSVIENWFEELKRLAPHPEAN